MVERELVELEVAGSIPVAHPIGEAIYWVSIVTFSGGILIFVKKLLARIKN